MGEVHELILRHGRQAAASISPERQRTHIEVAARILEEESNALGITYGGFCMTALPHKRIPDDQVWERRCHRLRLTVEPGWLPFGGRSRLIGVPYGSRARMMLLYLQTQAVQTQSPEVELGRSMYEWLSRMSIPVGGNTYRMVREQANRISACHLTFFWEDGATESFEKDAIVKGGIRLRSTNDSPAQGQFWDDTVRLSDSFFRALREHPVPVWEPALREISNQSMALDIYVWLAYRLRALVKPTAVSWPAVFAQFGAGFAELRNFKPKFQEALAFALAVYPAAVVKVETTGLVLHPSRPPVENRIFPLSAPGS
jgi:hypothetical protein